MAIFRREIRRPTMILLIIWLMLLPLIGKFNHNNSNAQVNTPCTTLKTITKINNNEPPTMSNNDINVRKNDVVLQPKLHIGVHLYQLNHNNRNAQVKLPCTTLKTTTKINNDEPPTMSNNDINIQHQTHSMTMIADHAT